jgi:predicted nuclease of predicted toxin-antitoxin system
MKFLFDENISYRILKKISTLAPQSLHVSRIGLTQPASDLDIWNFAKKKGFILVSFDEDFQDLSHLNGFPPKVVLLRVGNSSTQNIAEILFSKWADVEQFYQSETFGLLEIF